MRKALIGLTIVFLSVIPSTYYGWFIRFWWVDVVQHFLGGFFLAMLFAHYLKDNFVEGKKLQNILIVIGATIFIGVVWEFAEYIGNQTLINPIYKYFHIRTYFMGDLRDTVKDLLMDILGALTYSLHFFRSRNAHKIETDFENVGNGNA